MSLFKKVIVGAVVLIVVLIICNKQFHWIQSDKVEKSLGKESHAGTENTDSEFGRSTERKNKVRLSKKVISELETFRADIAAIVNPYVRYADLDYEDAPPAVQKEMMLRAGWHDEEAPLAVQKAFDKITEPRTLELIYWSNDISSPIGPGPLKESVLFRLAELKTDESARTAVKIYFHKDAWLDAGYGYGAKMAIVRAGPLALPYLEKETSNPNERLKEDAKTMIEYIKKGKPYE